MSKKKVVDTKKNKTLNKSVKNTCPYDDFACRVYEFCGTQKCSKRAERLKKNELT